MSTKPFGIDVSRWQGSINWDAVAIHEPRVQFAGIRATISWAYMDGWFNRNWSEAQRIGIARAAYHVVYPGVSAKQQMDNFLKVVGNDFGELPLVLDIELAHNQPADEITAVLLECAAIIETVTSQKPILYSRASFVDEHITGKGNPPAWLNRFDWWIAHYLRSGEEHQGPPVLPKGLIRDRCLVHQTTPSGAPIGTQSKTMNYDRWQYDEAHFLAYQKSRKVLTLSEKVDLLWKAHPEIHP
jgi:GH25 family lysozyme M1 (1,4-beta-N-acetylmuramidase)